MNWKFWKKRPETPNPWRTITFSGSTTTTTTKPPTVSEQIEALTKRVAELEKDTAVFSNDGIVYYFTSGSSSSWGEHKSRPRVGEGVRLLMQHLGLSFQHGTKTPDTLVKAKKPKKK